MHWIVKPKEDDGHERLHQQRLAPGAAAGPATGGLPRFSKLADSDLSLRDFFAFDLVLCDQDRAADGKATSSFMPYARTKYPHDKYANNLVVIDLKNKFKGDSVVNLHLTKL